jgi:hypothetical protein
VVDTGPWSLEFSTTVEIFVRDESMLYSLQVRVAAQSLSEGEIFECKVSTPESVNLVTGTIEIPSQIYSDRAW